MLAHASGSDTATPLRFRTDNQDPVIVIVGVAGPGPSIAMKLQSVMKCGRAKEATDPVHFYD